MGPKLRLKNQSKKAERVKAENQYFPYSPLIRRAMVEAYCPTLVELVLFIIQAKEKTGENTAKT